MESCENVYMEVLRRFKERKEKWQTRRLSRIFIGS
jgi:hypothetical protein